ncbi:MAG: flagellar hook-length control protein FliK [Stagnimonas sp.]|nr:flagellar hook-length control protein FliK [Stagnimonas sp.]
MNGLAAASAAPTSAPLTAAGPGLPDAAPATTGAQAPDFAALLKPATGAAEGGRPLPPAVPGSAAETRPASAPTAAVRKGPAAPPPDGPLKDLFLDCPAPSGDPSVTAFAASDPVDPEPGLAGEPGSPGTDWLALFGSPAAPPTPVMPANPQAAAPGLIADGPDPLARRESLATLALNPALPEAAVAPPATEPALPDLAAVAASPAPTFSLGPATPAAIATPVPTSPPAPPPLDTRCNDWPEQLGERIRWQLGDGVQEARIELAPAGLGALELRVQVEAGQVQLHIGAAQAATRELLNEALPRLRELLGDSGLSLGQTSVFDQQERTPARSAPGWPGRASSAFVEDDGPLAWTPVRAGRGLFDHYA